jgi:hypothetical protein
VLIEALDRAATLRWIGEDEIDGKKQKVISVLRPDNQQLSLSFDAQTNLLTRYGYIYADPVTGDSEIAQTYSGYRTVGKVKIPSARVLYNSGGVIQETEFTDVRRPRRRRPRPSARSRKTFTCCRVLPGARTTRCL